MQKAQENDQGQDPVEPAQPYPPGKLHNRAHAEPCRRNEIEACEETEQVRLELSHLRQAHIPMEASLPSESAPSRSGPLGVLVRRLHQMPRGSSIHDGFPVIRSASMFALLS